MAAKSFNSTDLDALRWYADRANNGRGSLSTESKRLVRLGMLRLTWTSMHCWILTITTKGKTELAKAVR